MLLQPLSSGQVMLMAGCSPLHGLQQNSCCVLLICTVRQLHDGRKLFYISLAASQCPVATITCLLSVLASFVIVDIHCQTAKCYCRSMTMDVCFAATLKLSIDWFPAFCCFHWFLEINIGLVLHWQSFDLFCSLQTMIYHVYTQ